MVRVQNKTKTTQIFYDSLHKIEVPPNSICFLKDSRYDSFTLSKKDFLQTIPQGVNFVRDSGLGDLLVTLVVSDELRRFYGVKEVYLTIQSNWRSSAIVRKVADALGIAITATPPPTVPSIILTGLFEFDYSDDYYRGKNRIDILREALFLPTGEKPAAFEAIPYWAGKKGVVFCSGGRSLIRELPVETARQVEQRLSRRFRSVTHIREGWQFLNEEELWNFIQNARVVVTVDSAPLWIAHFTHTPVVLLTAHRPPKTRLNYHPLWPDGVESIELYRYGCGSPCYERPSCGGPPFLCLNGGFQWGEELESKIEKVMWR